MRILLLTHYYAPETGPPQLRWSALAREFTTAGHHLDVIAPYPHYPTGSRLDGYTPSGSWRDPEPGTHGESIYRVGFRPTRGTLRSVMHDQMAVAVRSIAATVSLRRRLAPDVIVATAPALPSLIAGWLAKVALRRPLIVEIRDAWPDLIAVSDHWEDVPQRDSLPKRIVLRIAPRVISWLTGQADRVVTTTAGFADILTERGTRNVSVVRNVPHPIDNYPVHTPPPRSAPGVLRVAYLGTVGRAQGLQTAVEAVRIARHAGVRIELRVIGTGVGREFITRLAEENDLPVTVRGAQPRREIHHHYAWADTVLVMLRDWEPLTWTVPSKLYEAMSLGIHVSGSAAGETADIITATGCGFVVPPEDAQALAAQWVALASTLPAAVDRDRARAWLEQHSTETLAGHTYLSLLEGLVSSTPGSARRSRTTPPRTVGG
ncbi:MAG: glycosyltransferase family 4 protein [Dermatophilaceae bacterium]|nr:glycosyltransferase family 4 protein [Intrasporangiaceae bacterium]